MNLYVEMNEEEFDRYRNKIKQKELYEYPIIDLALALMESIKVNGGQTYKNNNNIDVTSSIITLGKANVGNIKVTLSIEQAGR